MAKHEEREAQQDALGRTLRLPAKKPQVQTLEQGSKLLQEVEKELSRIAKDSAQQIVGIKKEARDVAIYMDSQFAGKRSSSNTLSQWEAVKTACANAVEGIRNIVGDSVSLLEDLTVFTEYLRTPKDTPEEKSKQIQDYMDFLTRKSKNAQAALEQLRVVLDRLKTFQRYWPSDATEYTKELAPRLKVIRDNINNLLQKPIIVTGDANDTSRASGLAKSLILILPLGTASELRSALHIDSRVESEAFGASNKNCQVFNVLDNLVDVGRLLLEDIKSVQDSTRLSNDEGSKRVRDAKLLYDCLSKSLKVAKKILSQSPGSSDREAVTSRTTVRRGNVISRLWRKLLGR